MAARRKATKKKASRTAKKSPSRKTAKRKTAKRGAKRGASKTALDLIISKSRTKAAVNDCNVSSEFYAALDGYVREAIQSAEDRATANGRKTLRPQDL